MKKFALICSLVTSGIFIHNTLGQNIDSLKNVIQHTLDQKEKIHTYQKVAISYIYVDPKIAKTYADSALTLAREINSKGYILSSMNLVGSSYLLHQDYDNAEKTFRETIELMKQTGKTQNMGGPLSNLGTIYYEQGKLDSAIFYQEESLRHRKTQNDSLGIGKTLINFSNALIALGDHEEAIKRLSTAEILFENLKLIGYRGVCLYNVGNIYLDMQEHTKALQYYDKAKQFFFEANDIYRYNVIDNNRGSALVGLGKYDEAERIYEALLKINDFDKRSRAYNYTGLGDVNFFKGDFEKAIHFYQKGYALEKELGTTKEIAITCQFMGDAYIQLGKYDLAQDKLEEGYELSKANGFLSEQAHIKELLLVNNLKANHLQAYAESLDELLILRDSNYNNEKISSINEIETKYRVKEQLTENRLLKTEKELQASTIQQQRFTILGTIVGVLLLTVLSFLFYKQSKERKKHNQLLIEKNENIESLHKELSHRVKNNLAFISTLLQMQGRRLESGEAKQAIKEGEARVEAMSILHNKLYLKNDDSSIILKDYFHDLCLNLQQTYPYSGKRPTIQQDIDDLQIDGESAIRLGLIVNELVTNSFKYAFKEQPNPQIDIQVHSKEDKYEFTYQDNGRGFPNEPNKSKAKSLGLKLIQLLAKQLKGTVSLQNNEGVLCKMIFKV